MNGVLAVISFTIQRRIRITPLLVDNVRHSGKKFCGAQRARVVCLRVPGRVAEREHCSVWNGWMFPSQLPLHLLGRRQQWPPLGKSQSTHPWCLVNSLASVKEMAPCHVIKPRQTSPWAFWMGRYQGRLKSGRPAFQSDLKLSLYYLGNDLALQCLLSWL